MGVEAAVIRIMVRHKNQEPFAADGKLGRCRGKNCLQPVVYVLLPSGKRPPYDLDGVPHFTTCVDVDDFRKARG